MKFAAPTQPNSLAQLTEIRAIMERNSRFISLSGVGAGVVAGAASMHFYFQQWFSTREYEASGFQLLLPAQGLVLVLFALGFGLGYIGYGLLMYDRYERPAGAATAVRS